MAKRLADMGFVPGDEIQVVSNGVPGPLVVLVKGSRLVLGRGMAEKILVKSSCLTSLTGPNYFDGNARENNHNCSCGESEFREDDCLQ